MTDDRVGDQQGLRTTPDVVSGEWQAAGYYEVSMVDADGAEGVGVHTFRQAVHPSEELLRDLRVPDGYPILWVDEDYSRWSKHHEIHVASFGVMLPDLPRDAFRTRIYGRGNGPELMLLITLQWVAFEGFEPFGEIRWEPHGGKATLVGVNLDRPIKVLEPIRKAMRVVTGLKISPRGKRPGDGATWPGDLPDFLEDLWTTLEALTAASGTRFGHDPTSRLFRSQMREHPSERTLRDWLGKAGLRPRDIKSGKISRANYPQFVAK